MGPLTLAPFVGLALLLSFVAGSDDLEIRFEGNRAISGARMRAELAPWLEDLKLSPKDEGARDDCVFEVVELYHKNGFPEASAELHDLETEVGAAVVLKIVEGPRAFLARGKPTFVGRTAIDEEILERAFPWLRPGLIPGSRPIFTEAARDSGIAGIRLLYSLAGYLDVRVTSKPSRQRVTRDESSEESPTKRPTIEIQVEVVIQIDEGEPTLLDAVEILPGSSTSPELLKEYAGVGVGGRVSPRLAIEVRGRIYRQLQENGFKRCQVRTELTETAPQRRALIIEVSEGEKHTFGVIRVENNERTRSGFIRARMGIEFGDPYRASDVEKGQRALNATGLFEKFDVQLVHDTDPTRLNLVITVTERDTIRFDTRIGFSTYELGRFGLGVQLRNLFGLGIEGRVDGLVSSKGEEVEARLRYPFLNDRGLELELRGKYRRFEEVSFERVERVGTIGLNYPATRLLHLNTGFELRDVTIGDVREELQNSVIDDSSRASLVFLGARYDGRDSAIDPTKGHFITARFEYADRALGADLDFVRLTARASRTDTLGGNWRLVLAGQAGGIHRLDPGEVPLGERFFLGGSRSVRSYRQDRMPPLDQSEDPIGGESFIAGTVEARHPIWAKISGAVFLDAGSLSTEIEDFAGTHWRFASGVGAIWSSPIGPLRLDWAITLNPERGEDYWAVHVLIGQPF